MLPMYLFMNYAKIFMNSQVPETKNYCNKAIFCEKLVECILNQIKCNLASLMCFGQHICVRFNIKLCSGLH